MPPEASNSKSRLLLLIQDWSIRLPSTVQRLDFLGRFWFAIAAGLGAGIGFGFAFWMIYGDAETAAEWGRHIALYITGVGALLIAALRVDWTRKNDARVQNERAWEFAAKTYIEWKNCISEFSNAIDDLESLFLKHILDRPSIGLSDFIQYDNGRSELYQQMKILSSAYKNARVKHEILHLSVLPVSEPLYIRALNIQNHLYAVRKLQSELCGYLISNDGEVRSEAKHIPNALPYRMNDIYSLMLEYEQAHVNQRGDALSF